MWEQYKEKDSRIIRPINGNEFFTVSTYVNIFDVFPKFSAEEFKKNAQENLSKIECFNLAIKRIGKDLFWINKPFELHLEEVEWNENEEVDNYLKNEDKYVIPYDPKYEENNDVFVMYYFKICQLKNNKTKLTFIVNHRVCDARSLSFMFSLIRRVINGEKLEKVEEPLPSYGQCECYQNIDESLEKPPKVWKEINKASILPKIPGPYQYITLHHIFDYAPIATFMKKTGITVQAMLIAMMSRAARKYNNLPKETPLWSVTPCNSRNSQYATETFKNQKLYCNVAGVYPCVVGQETLMQDLEHCKEKLKESIKSNDDVRQILSGTSLINPETLQFTPTFDFPDPHFKAVVHSSNLGRIDGNLPILHFVYNGNFGGYIFYCHAYHTSEKLIIALIMPVGFDQKYVDIVKEEMNNIFIPENIVSKN